MSDSSTPDFAMLRAVDILAGLYERNKATEELPRAPYDRPIVLFNESIALDVDSTTQEEVEKRLGIGFSYPARGWHTYCVRGSDGKREFLSLFFSEGRLASAELYYPKADRAPKLEAVGLRFRFVPGELALGQTMSALPEHFGRLSALAEAFGAYTDMMDSRFPGGVAYIMGNEGRVERLALYVLRSESAPPRT